MTLDRSHREFLAEANEIVEHLSGGLAAIDADRRKGVLNPNRINEVFRQAHSLKGLAGMFGVEAMSHLAHQMETVLDGLRLGRVTLNDALMETLYACTDAFSKLLGDVKDDRPVDDGTVGDVRRRLDAAAVGGGGAPITASAPRVALPPEALSALTEYEEHRLSENLKSGTPIYKVHAPLPLSTFEKDLQALTTVLTDAGEVITTLPSTDDSGKLIIFDVVVASTVGPEALSARVAELGSYRVERVDDGATQRAVEAAPQLTAPLAPGGHTGEDESASLRQISETVRVDIRKLDELMGIVGELVLARGGLSRVTNELKQEIGFQGLAVDLHRLVRTLERRIVDLQTAIMQVRMVPLGQVFERMSRTVQRTATALGKQAELDISGEETELDKLIVEDLVDPLMHLVRNAVDHGIETKEARIAAGKPATGRITLRAYPRGNHVIIDIVDDGRGIDEVAVKRTALERGVVDEEHVGQLSRRDVWNLIFSPGFSTRRDVTETSGRGVGLDVVKTNVARMSGLIDVESTSGRGTRFSITLPITLAIIQAVIIRAARRVYALPLASVLEIVAVQQSDLCRIEGKEMLQLRGQTLPVLRLGHLFFEGGRPEPRGRGALAAAAARGGETTLPRAAAELDGMGYAAVVGLAQHRAALLIDDVLGQQDIVIKSLGAYLAGIKGIAGATHLGDHETILVLDVAALVQELLSTDEPRGRAA